MKSIKTILCLAVLGSLLPVIENKADGQILRCLRHRIKCRLQQRLICRFANDPTDPLCPEKCSAVWVPDDNSWDIVTDCQNFCYCDVPQPTPPFRQQEFDCRMFVSNPLSTDLYVRVLTSDRKNVGGFYFKTPKSSDVVSWGVQKTTKLGSIFRISSKFDPDTTEAPPMDESVEAEYIFQVYSKGRMFDEVKLGADLRSFDLRIPKWTINFTLPDKESKKE